MCVFVHVCVFVRYTERSYLLVVQDYFYQRGYSFILEGRMRRPGSWEWAQPLHCLSYTHEDWRSDSQYSYEQPELVVSLELQQPRKQIGGSLELADQRV